MTRTFLSRMLLVAGTVALVACGPRLKPVEYEEPRNSESTSADDDESSSSHGKKKVADSDTSESSSASSSSSKASGSGKGGGCSGKSSTCGSPCTECAPGDMDCMEVLVQKQCNAQHKCVAAPVDCSAAEKSDKSKDKDKGKDKDKKKSKKDE